MTPPTAPYAFPVTEALGRSHLLRRADTAASWALDGFIAFVTLIPTAAIYSHGANHTRLAFAEVVGGALATTLPLLVRRRWPVQVLAVILVVGVAVPGPALFFPPALVAIYTIASRRSAREAMIGAGVSVVAFALHRILWGYNLPLLGVISGLALAALAVALGLYQSTRLAYVDGLQDRARQLERERELLAEQAATDERLRIARELHDVVAHNVSLMVVQAHALAATTEDGRAAENAAAIADLGRGAMSEMHRTLDLMRPDGGNGDRSPQPTLADLDTLIEQASRAGASATLSVSGKPRPLAAGVELSAYRIVQEALTNTLKHGGPTPTRVVVRGTGDALEVEIVDAGGNGDAAQVGSGHGLVGMRERAALYGGTLDAGPLPQGGFRVHARFPLRGCAS